MAISALIADDEASARSRLRKMLSAYPLELIDGDAKDGVEALEAIRQHRPQVVFLDIEMPGLDGFGVVEGLAPEQAPLIVFVTAYDEHALAAFEANAVAYLLKPVAEDRLRTVIGRLEQLLRAPAEAAQEVSRAGAVARSAPRPLRQVLAVQREGYLLLPLDQVCFFEVADGVTYANTGTARYRTHYGINDLETRLPSPPFFRAHRSFIVNLDQVSALHPLFKGALMLTMKDAKASEIQVSERQAPHLRELLQL